MRKGSSIVHLTEQLRRAGLPAEELAGLDLRELRLARRRLAWLRRAWGIGLQGHSFAALAAAERGAL